jgi:hypothetical protein
MKTRAFIIVNDVFCSSLKRYAGLKSYLGISMRARRCLKVLVLLLSFVKKSSCLHAFLVWGLFVNCIASPSLTLTPWILDLRVLMLAFSFHLLFTHESTEYVFFRPACGMFMNRSGQRWLGTCLFSCVLPCKVYITPCFVLVTCHASSLRCKHFSAGARCGRSDRLSRKTLFVIRRLTLCLAYQYGCIQSGLAIAPSNVSS